MIPAQTTGMNISIISAQIAQHGKDCPCTAHQKTLILLQPMFKSPKTVHGVLLQQFCIFTLNSSLSRESLWLLSGRGDIGSLIIHVSAGTSEVASVDVWISGEGTLFLSKYEVPVSILYVLIHFHKYRVKEKLKCEDLCERYQMIKFGSYIRGEATKN